MNRTLKPMSARCPSLIAFSATMLLMVGGALAQDDDPCAEFPADIERLTQLVAEHETGGDASALRDLGHRLATRLPACGHLMPDPDLGLTVSRLLDQPWPQALWASWTADRTPRAAVRAIAAFEAAEHLRAAGRPISEQIGRVDQALQLAPLLPAERWEAALPRLARGIWLARNGGGALVMTAQGPGSAHSERFALFAAAPDLIAFASDHASIEAAVAQKPALLESGGPILDGLSMLERFAELEADHEDAEIADRAQTARQTANMLLPLLIRLSPDLAFADRPVFRLEGPDDRGHAHGERASSGADVPAAPAAPRGPSRFGPYVGALVAGIVTALVLIVLRRRGGTT